MTANTETVEALMMRVQQAFLDRPELHLTLPDARERFGVDYRTCAAVLHALLDARVLARMPDGTYGRFFPHAVDRRRRNRRRAPRVTSIRYGPRHAA